MKKSIIVLCSLILALIVSTSAQAVPKLQIYIPGSYYDMDSETWIIDSYDYQLWVIGSSDVIKDVKIAFAVPEGENGSINVDWVDPSFSEFTMSKEGGLDYSDNQEIYTNRGYIDDVYLYGDSSEGEYPLDGNGKKIPGHGVFPTNFYEYYIGNFGLGETVYNFSPPDDFSGEIWEELLYINTLADLENSGLDSATGEIKVFNISAKGYTWVDIVAYDHYVNTKDKARYVFSPFSHDGASGSTVPEPATMMLFGIGLLSFAGVLRRKKL